jgi:hypothetical protein
MGKKIGAPTKFNDSLESVAIALAEKGHIDREIADIIGVSESALNEHKKRKPEFHESLKKAKIEFDNTVVEQALLKRAIGLTVKEVQIRTVDGKQIKTIIEKELPPDATSLALYLRNRMPEKWCKEKQNFNIEVENQCGLTQEEALQVLRDDPFFSKSSI